MRKSRDLRLLWKERGKKEKDLRSLNVRKLLKEKLSKNRDYKAKKMKKWLKCRDRCRQKERMQKEEELK